MKFLLKDRSWALSQHLRVRTPRRDTHCRYFTPSVEKRQQGILKKHGNQVSAHGLGKSPKQVVEMSRRGVTTERQRKMRTKTHSQNSTNFGCTNVLFLVQKQSYAPSIRIIIDESTRQFNMIFDRASFDAVSFLYNLIRFNTIFRTIFRVCCMFRFSTLQ